MKLVSPSIACQDNQLNISRAIAIPEAVSRRNKRGGKLMARQVKVIEVWTGITVK